MNIILTNPYRFLGIPVNSSEKLIKKNIQNFEVFLSIGQQPKAQETDFIFFGNVERNSVELTETISKLELPQDRINYSLFWFSKFTAVDNDAFINLKSNEIDEAIEKWESTIIENTITKNNFTSFKNLGVLYYYKAFTNNSIDISNLVKAITLFGKSLNSDDFWNNYISHFNNSLLINTANRTESLSYLFRTMFKEIQEKCNFKKDVEFIKKLLNNKQIPKSLKDEISLSLIYDKITFIETEVENCKNNLKINKILSYNYGVDLYNKIKEDFYFVINILGEDNYRVIMLSDKISNEFLNCAVNTFNNDLDERFTIQKVETLLNFAEEYAKGDLARNKLIENEKAFKEAAGSRKNDTVISNFFEKLDKANKDLEKYKHPYIVYMDFLIILEETLQKIDENVVPEYRIMILNLSAALFRNCAVKLSNDYNDFIRSVEILQKSLLYVKDPYIKSRIQDDLNTVNSNARILEQNQINQDYYSGILNGKNSPKKIDVYNIFRFILPLIIFGILIVLCKSLTTCNNSSRTDIKNNSPTKTNITSTTSENKTSFPLNDDNSKQTELRQTLPKEVEDLKVTRLKTGATPYNSYFKSIRSDKSSHCWLKLINTTDEDAIISLVNNSNDKVVRCVYVRANESYTIRNIPFNNYYMKVYTGTAWSNEKTFKNNQIKGGYKYHEDFAKFTRVISIEQSRTSRGVYYSSGEWTLYKITSTSFYNFNSISSNEFFTD